MKALLFIALQLASYGSDAYFTQRDMQGYRFAEHDPLARPFTRNTLTLSLTSAAAMGATLYGERWLRRRRHQRFAETMEIGTIAGHAWGAAYTATHYHPIR